MALSATHFWTRTQGMKREFQQLLKPTQPRALPLSPSPLQAPAPREMPSGRQHFQAKARRGISNLSARRAGSPRNRPPLLVSHAGFLGLHPAAPRPSSSRTPAPQPGATKDRALSAAASVHTGLGTPFSFPRHPITHLLLPGCGNPLAADVPSPTTAVLFPM